MLRQISVFLFLFCILFILPVHAQHSATLNWNPSTDGSGNPTLGYDIYRGTAAGAESVTPLNSTIADVDCLLFSACKYVDSTVVAGQTYYYVVKAALNGLFSPASNEVSTAIPLAAPTGVVVISQ